MDFRLHANDTVRHFKGGIYTIIAMAIKDAETGELGVAYVRNCDGTLWLRPYDMFVGEVDREKYPEVEQKYRLEKIETPSFDETQIVKYSMLTDKYQAPIVIKHKENGKLYILLSDNFTHTETKNTMAIFVELDSEVPEYSEISNLAWFDNVTMEDVSAK